MSEKRWKDPDQEYTSDTSAAAEAPATQTGEPPSELRSTNGEIPYATSPTWSAPYEKERQSAARRIESQQPFSYDPATDPTYQQYEDTYTRMGEKARDDTIGVLRARGGGQVSSYAAIAAQQANEAYMQELADKVPQLRQMAYQMWLNEGDRARSDLQMYDALNSADAARWSATVLDPYLQDRSYAFDREQFQAGREDAAWEKDFLEQKRQDGLDQWDQTIAIQQDQTAYERQSQAAAFMAQYIGDFSGYAKLWSMDEAKVEAMVAQYAKDKALTEAQAARELADWYAQYHDFSKLQELNVDTTYLERERDQALGGTQGNGSANYVETPKKIIDPNDEDGGVTPSVTNRADEGGVHVPTVGYVTWGELAELVDSGYVLESINKKTGTHTYTINPKKK